MSAYPPPMARWLFRLSAPPEDREVMLDDLAEEYRSRIAASGGSERMAARWYWRQVIGSVRHNLRRRLRRAPEPQHHRSDPMGSIRQDIRYAMRSLSRKPAVTVVAVLSLMLGIGATAVVFSVVDSAVLHPFPRSLDRLVAVGSAYPRIDRTSLGFFEVHSAPEYHDVKREATTLEHVVAYDLGNRHIVAGTRPERVLTAFWWGNVFPTLGMEPALGRGFVEEDLADGAPVALISHRLWVALFAGDEDALGQTIAVNGEPYVLIGVMPEDVVLGGTELWLPMWAAPDVLPRGRRQFQILARMREGVSLADVNTELALIAGRIEQQYVASHEEYAGWRLEAATWTAISVAQYQTAGMILLAAMAFVVILVCVNVANLLLARAAGRRQEFSVRRALGAGEGRLLQQLMTENAAIALMGGLLGIGLAIVLVPVVADQLPRNMLPVGSEVVVSSRVLMVASLATVATIFLFGLAPAWQGARSDLRTVLQSDSGQVTHHRGTARWHTVFVTVQVALAVVLLAGAGLLIHSFMQLQRVAPGFDTSNAVRMRVTLPHQLYRGEEVTTFFTSLQTRVAERPGVRRVAVTSQVPPNLFFQQRIAVGGGEARPDGALPSAFVTVASQNYVEAMGIPLVSGRTFDTGDRETSLPVVVLNEPASRRLFPNGDAVGQRIRIGGPDSDAPWTEVIGIVGATKNRGLDAESAPEVFVNVRQVRGWWNQLYLVVGTDGPPLDILPAVRETVASLDPTLPVYNIQTIDQAYAASVAQRRLAAATLGGFALTALLLAAVGIYGVMSYSVNQRTREIGMRMAMGAEARQVRRQIVLQALKPVGAGLAIGIPSAVLLSRQLADLMFQVAPGEPVTIGVMAGVLAMVALLAGYLPARRASRLDPVRALRYE